MEMQQNHPLGDDPLSAIKCGLAPRQRIHLEIYIFLCLLLPNVQMIGMYRAENLAHTDFCLSFRSTCTTNRQLILFIQNNGNVAHEIVTTPNLHSEHSPDALCIHNSTTCSQANCNAQLLPLPLSLAENQKFVLFLLPNFRRKKKRNGSLSKSQPRENAQFSIYQK